MRDGFALPATLIASVVMLMILTTAVSVTVAVRGSLQDQNYTRLARLASQAGVAFATACTNSNESKVTWSNDKPLKPNTDCNGDVVDGVSEYIHEEDGYRTYFVVKEPIATSITAEGYVEALRTSTGVAWRVWQADTASAQAVQSSLPVGASLDGYWTTAPPGYLLEDGSEVSRAVYSDLYAVIGDAFGDGDGSTTFNLPDSRGRVAVNISSDTEFNELGKTSGAKTHTLTNAQVPATPVRTDNVTSNEGWRSTTGVYNFSSNGTYRRLINGNTGGQLHVDGGGQAHNNIQPSIVITRVIKY